jgi:hypothetical protein
MNLATAPGTLSIVQHCLLYGGATLNLYTGSIPATPETAASGTVLATWTFATPGFTGVPTTSGGYDYLTASFVSSSASPSNSGTAGYARATFATPTARANTTAYTRGALVTASSNLWVCTASGTTSASSTLTGTTYGTIDGTATFDYVGASTITAIADFTVGTSGTDIILGTTTITTGTNVTISSFRLQISVV